MATLALSAVGAAAGASLLPAGFSFLGASLTGGAIGRALGGFAGAYIDSALFASSGQSTVYEGPRLADLTVTASTEGAAIPRLYGRAKLGGQIIWATNFEEEVSTTTAGSSKGLGGSSGTQTSDYSYYANFAVALCEGEITRLGRVWADGEEIALTDYTWRLYTGTESQEPDSLIEAKEGAGMAPAYRGLAYVVFERLPLADFGNRIPQLAFEVFRAIDNFEQQVRGVTLIPAAGEFVYHPTEVRVDGGGGLTYSENRHTNLAVSDWAASLDQLQDTLPNCSSVSLFVTWFGNDLRCSHCSIKPKVDTRDKGTGTTPISWGVAGLTRADADVVTSHDGVAAYGGSPSDNTVIAAIRDLHARGMNVVYTPFILMDVPHANVLSDPYTGTDGQPAYPWRGRITCSPAPGRSGTPDKTRAAADQIAAFIGTAAPSDFAIADGQVVYSGPDEWSYRRFILHAAMLAQAAGGVEAFVIGSEMRGLSQVRDSGCSYPFVQSLIGIAADVAQILPMAKLTYAADWSEYFGHHPADGSGDVFFHLDPLWASPDIDAVGIDCYWPLSDWRDGTDHLDYASGARSIHDLSYLKGNIAGGEGFDWYYASLGDRVAQRRAGISDGYGRPWVFRYKDIRSWWQNAHFDRPGGTESGTPTQWTPESKPIWFTELGCSAVDKGANQPNVFYDPKSSESFLPYFSRGTRDDLMQRRYARAFLEWFDPDAPDFSEDQNPASSVYPGRMVDVGRVMLYTWDARPYPAFPAWRSVWADGENWLRGHWLTGRTADAPLGETVARIVEDCGFRDYDASQLSGSLSGYVIDRVMSARDAIQPLETAYFFDSFESEGKVRFTHRGRSGSVATFTPDMLVETRSDAALYELTRAQETDLPRAAKLTYIDADRDYQQATAEGRRSGGGSGRVSSAQMPVVTNYAAARAIAETMVQEAWATREQAKFTLPPSCLALDASDVVTLNAGGREMMLRLTGMHLGDAIEAEAMSIEPHLYGPFATPARTPSAAAPATYGKQAAAFLDLPLIRGDEVSYAGSFAAYGSPWPGGVALYRSPAASGYELAALARTPAIMGTTVSPFYGGPTGRWDRGNVLRVTLYGGQLASAEALLVLGGANFAAVENTDGEWEVIQFTTAALVSGRTYDLSGLLRGQSGTESAMRDPVTAGARFVLLNAAVTQVDMTSSDVGLSVNWKYGPSCYNLGHAAYTAREGFAFCGVGLRPLSPCHVRGAFDGGGNLLITWKRRTRQGGDSWDTVEVPLAEDTEAYEVDILDGGGVKRTLTATGPAVTYSAAQQIADFGSPQTACTVRVYQVSATHGRGAVREAVIP